MVKHLNIALKLDDTVTTLRNAKQLKEVTLQTIKSDIISGNSLYPLKLLLMSSTRTRFDLWKRITTCNDLTCGNDIVCKIGAKVSLLLL